MASSSTACTVTKTEEKIERGACPLGELKEAGATIAPFIPAFYQQPTTIEDLMDHFIMRLLDQLGLDSTISSRWT